MMDKGKLYRLREKVRRIESRCKAARRRATPAVTAGSAAGHAEVFPAGGFSRLEAVQAIGIYEADGKPLAAAELRRLLAGTFRRRKAIRRDEATPETALLLDKLRTDLAVDRGPHEGLPVRPA